MELGVKEIDDFMRTLYQHEQDFFTLSRVQKTVVALVALANHLAPIPGRKNLIGLSDSFPIAIGFEGKAMSDSSGISGRSETSVEQTAQTTNSSRAGVRFDTDIERAARALNSANVAIYPVQATGLAPNLRPIDSGIAPTTIGGRPGSMAQPVIARANWDSSQDTMNLMA